MGPCRAQTFKPGLRPFGRCACSHGCVGLRTSPLLLWAGSSAGHHVGFCAGWWAGSWLIPVAGGQDWSLHPRRHGLNVLTRGAGRLPALLVGASVSRGFVLCFPEDVGCGASPGAYLPSVFSGVCLGLSRICKLICCFLLLRCSEALYALDAVLCQACWVCLLFAKEPDRPCLERHTYTAYLYTFSEYICVLYIKGQGFFCLPTTNFCRFGGEIATIENV